MHDTPTLLKQERPFGHAEQSAASLADLLRYGLAVVQAKHRGPRIGLQGEIARGHRTMLAITSDGSEIEAVKSAAGPFQPFEIAKEHVTIFQEALIFEIARLLSPSYGSLTEIEALIERCISWFSLSQMRSGSERRVFEPGHNFGGVAHPE